MKEISIKKILGQLEAGVSRTEIEAELELNPRESKVLWQHPKLKGVKKSKYKVELNIIEGDERQDEVPTTDMSRPSRLDTENSVPVF